MPNDVEIPARLRWARFRFGVVAPLLTMPPEHGELAAQLAELASKRWPHPTTGESIRLSVKTIERWLYIARGTPQALEALARKVPKHAGTHPAVSEAVAGLIRQLRLDHPHWTYQLVRDNLGAIARERGDLDPLPSYQTIVRYMKQHGLLRARKPRRHEQAPGFVPREKRSFEMGHVHALWHCDFHVNSRKVLEPNGQWRKATLFAMLDDRSRLCCHAQWYFDYERTEVFIHGTMQALQKRGLPRAIMSDNGKAMLANETQEGLDRLTIAHHPTLPQTPEQNGKQEVFWAQIEGRLMPMLEGERELTLELLNRATQAWVEQEYNQSVHDETKQTPFERAMQGPSVVRACPPSDELRRVFRTERVRQQRRSDGTITVEGVRYEIPTVYRTLERIHVRVARWDLSTIDMVDPRHGTHLCALYPIDKEGNADARRRVLPQLGETAEPKPTGIAPLLREYMAEYAATGLPPAYIPLEREYRDPAEQDSGDNDDNQRINDTEETER
jgi:transposase InsO family protein